MSDWQPGDLALCVDDQPNEIHRDYTPIRRGAIYTVADVIELPHTSPALVLREAMHAAKTHGFESLRFRKIPPLTDEERDEFLADLNIREPQTC